jgi:hypothetical protein
MLCLHNLKRLIKKRMRRILKMVWWTCTKKRMRINLELSMTEVIVLDREERECRYPMDLEKRTCTCRHWQISGLSCIHAMFFVTSLQGLASEIDQYVHEYYSVAKFNATYADNLPSIEAKQQCDIVDPGFVLHAPIQTRAPAQREKKAVRGATARRLAIRARKTERERERGGEGNWR